jgi:methyl coenzyme M reductase beta subunit
MPPDASAIDAAILAKLQNDSELLAVMPDGVWFDEAPVNSRQFVIVSLIDERDVPMFAARAFENALYLVKAVSLGTSGQPVKTAAARIDALLDRQPLVAEGYGWMTTIREQRVRELEVDDVDNAVRWQHRGGEYRVFMSPI